MKFFDFFTIIYLSLTLIGFGLEIYHYNWFGILSYLVIGIWYTLFRWQYCENARLKAKITRFNSFFSNN